MTNEPDAASQTQELTAAQEESTMSNGEESRDMPEGVSSLMGLFSPPPQEKNDAAAGKAEEQQAPKQNGTTADDSKQAAADSAANVTPIDNEKQLQNGIAADDSELAAEDAAANIPHADNEEQQQNGATDASASTDLREQFRRRSTARSSGNNSKHAKTLMEMFDDPDQQPVPAKERHPPNPPAHERLPLLHNRKDAVEETAFGDLFPTQHQRKSSLGFSLDHLFSTPQDQTPQMSGGKSGRKVYSTANHTRSHTRTRTMSDFMPAIDESKLTVYEEESLYKRRIKEFCARHLQATTFVGSCMFLLYHVVFCLAMGSSIIRKHAETPILGLMAKMAACGIIFASPVYIYRLGSKIPALYPTVDLFLAPFMANLALIVDSTLVADDSLSGKDEDQVFIATLAVLSGIGMIFSGTLLVMGSKFKLANLGSYLPFPVLCGFFSAVGLLMWSLAFTVDTNGKSVHQVFTSGDMSLICNSLLHHFPSLLIAICMKWLGPLNPFLVSALVVCTVAVFYIVMAVTGMSLEEAREEQWFWSRSDLVYEGRVTHVSRLS